jgi:hypothetical protein
MYRFVVHSLKDGTIHQFTFAHDVTVFMWGKRVADFEIYARMKKIPVDGSKMEKKLISFSGGVPPVEL